MAKLKVYFGNKQSGGTPPAPTYKMYIGSVQITTMYIGSTEVTTAYVGSTVLKS